MELRDGVVAGEMVNGGLDRGEAVATHASCAGRRKGAPTDVLGRWLATKRVARERDGLRGQLKREVGVVGGAQGEGGVIWSESGDVSWIAEVVAVACRA